MGKFELPERFTGMNAQVSNFVDFKKLCYSLQSLGFFKVIKVDGYEYPKNYFDAEVADSNGRFHLLLNCFVPYLCFRKGKSEDVVYPDKPGITAAISSANADMIVIGSLQLSTQVDAESLQQLSKYEKAEVKNWLPSTVGDLMFSWYFD